MSELSKFIGEQLKLRAEHKRKVLAGDAEIGKPIHPHIAYQMAGSMGNHDDKDRNTTNTSRS